jgi:murein DD-endopeptidase MepM/ murein hydrolase activator NlpD
MLRFRHATGVAVVVLLAATGPPAAGAAGGAEFDGESGGAAYGAALNRQPVALRFGVSPRKLRADRAPRIVLHVDEPGVRTVRARVVFRARGGKLLEVKLGEVRTGHDVRGTWPKGARLAPGSYRVSLHVTDPAGQVLARDSGRRGTATLVVVAPPKAKPKPAPVPIAPTVPITPVRPDGVFPVQGPHTYGDGIGAARDGHTHQGVDVLAAEGTPVVAPTAGTIAFVDYQPCCAGRYIVENAADGRAFFFAHCRTNSIAVTPGQQVAAGASLCGVGHTGAASGSHLHFEIWVGGWRVDKNSHFIDPLPQLRAWDR